MFLFHRHSVAKQHINEYWGETKIRKRDDASVLLIFLMHGNIARNHYRLFLFTSVIIIDTVFQG